MVAATLASLALNGRMAEISKRDIWSPERIAQERPDVAYKLIAIDFLSPQVLILFTLPPQHGLHALLADGIPTAAMCRILDHQIPNRG